MMNFLLIWRKSMQSRAKTPHEKLSTRDETPHKDSSIDNLVSFVFFVLVVFFIGMAVIHQP